MWDVARLPPSDSPLSSALHRRVICRSSENVRIVVVLPASCVTCDKFICMYALPNISDLRFRNRTPEQVNASQLMSHRR